MSTHRMPLLSIVVPVYNEGAGLLAFHTSLVQQLDTLVDYRFEVMYCNDGSTDDSSHVLRQLAGKDKRVRVLSLTRNFGKEIATTAAITAADGEAVLTLDADGQHPVTLVPEFIAAWQSGNAVVIGLRTSVKASRAKRFGSRLFYALVRRMSGVPLVQGATDYRIIDASVRADFLKLTERNRISRGLVDWLGYRQAYINFEAPSRVHGEASYSLTKLSKLAIDSIISMSSSPLYATAYIGLFILPVSVVLGAVMLGNEVLGDPFNWHATGSAYVIVLLLFLVGILMLSQGVIGLYLSHIHQETQNRPLYIVNTKDSVRL